MPSSSKRSTQAEHDIFATYTAVYVCLQASKRLVLLRDVTELFSDLLDIGTTYLKACTLGGNNQGAIVAESKEAWQLTEANRVWNAGSLVHNVAWLLMKRYGREAAAVDCFRVASRLQREAEAIQDEQDRTEEEVQRRKDRTEEARKGRK